MEDATDVQDVRVVHVGLGPLGAAIARAVSSGLTVRTIGSGVVTSQEPQPGGALPAHRNVVLRLEARG